MEVIFDLGSSLMCFSKTCGGHEAPHDYCSFTVNLKDYLTIRARLQTSGESSERVKECRLGIS